MKEEPHKLLGDSCWQQLLETAEVYRKEEQVCRESLASIDWKYETLKDAVGKIRCPNCHSSLIKLVEEDEVEYSTETSLICRSCSYSFYFIEVIEQCLSDSLGYENERAINKGSHPILETCPECHHDTYVLSEDCCLFCSYKRDYYKCEGCGTPLSLNEQYWDNVCSFCSHYLSKITTE